jgi:hypothetical protein
MKSRLLDLKKLKFELRDIMRYDDVGDYFGDTIVAYDFKDEVVSNAIFLHEFIEYTLIKSAGIDPSLIDKFDIDKASPEEFPKEYALYEKFHDLANLVERQFIENLGLNWEEHDKVVNTVKVNIAVEAISEELHKENPSEAIIERAKEDVKEEIGDTLENENSS